MEADNMTKIKEAAIDVFSEKGYKEAKVTDIAEKVGVSVGTIYANFKGKKELFLKILSQKGRIQCTNPRITARSYFGLLYSFVIADRIMSPIDKEFSVDEIVGYAAQLL